MRYYIILLSFFFSCGTAPQQQESSMPTNQDSTDVETLADLVTETEQAKNSTKNSTREIVDVKPKSEIQLDSTHCSINMLVYIDQNFEALNKKDINSFLKTLHQDCNNNVEFSEWSNELIYKVLDSYTETTIDLLTTNQGYDLAAILDELENPINDGIMPQPLIAKIEELKNTDSTTNKVIKSLTEAANKY